jgi:hypothetical protein
MSRNVVSDNGVSDVVCVKCEAGSTYNNENFGVLEDECGICL